MPGSKLLNRIHEISQKARFDNVGIAFYDYETSLRFAYQGDRFFHAASTFKAGVLLAVLKAAEEGRLQLDDRLQIRNRFRSVIDGSPYRISRERDADSSVHRAIGGALSIRNLAEVMIVRSSNLATNLLIDLLGVDYVRQVLENGGARGVDIKRGVEDKLAHEQGINNEATAEGLVRLNRLLVEDHFLPPEFREEGLRILFAQEFKSMIPAKLPKDSRVAHKTGEISTHCHDAGLIYLPGRKPYVLAILTEHGPEVIKRNRAVAEMSAAVFRFIAGSQPEEKSAA
jgi:beta-lactamase class A